MVGGIPHEEVLEAEGGLAGEARLGGADEVLAGEGLEARLHRPARGGLRELDDGAPVEDLALDRATLERGAGLGLEPVEARAEERVQARREGERVEVALEGADALLQEQRALVHEHRDELLDEERIATRSSREPRAHGGLRAAEQALEQRVDLVLAERLEAGRDLPVGTVLGELRPGEAEHHDGCIRDRRREAGEQVEKRRLGPLDVVDDDDERPGAGGGYEEVADRPGRLLRGRGAVGEPEQLRDRRPHDAPPR